MQTAAASFSHSLLGFTSFYRRSVGCTAEWKKSRCQDRSSRRLELKDSDHSGSAQMAACEHFTPPTTLLLISTHLFVLQLHKVQTSTISVQSELFLNSHYMQEIENAFHFIWYSITVSTILGGVQHNQFKVNKLTVFFHSTSRRQHHYDEW